MKLLHIPTGTICSYLIYYRNASVYLGQFSGFFTEINEGIFNQIKFGDSVAIYGYREDGGTIFIGNHNNKESVNQGIEISFDEFMLID